MLAKEARSRRFADLQLPTRSNEHKKSALYYESEVFTAHFNEPSGCQKSWRPTNAAARRAERRLCQEQAKPNVDQQG